MKLDNKIIIFVVVFALLGLSFTAFGQSRGLPSAGGAPSVTKTIPSGTPSVTPSTAEETGEEQTIVKTDLEGPLQEEEKVYLNVHDADIKDVIKQISKATSKNFIIDDKIRGKITIISERPMTREEAYQTFLSALEVAGYTTVKGPANVIKIVSLKDASKSPIPTHVDTTPYTDSFITRLIPLENISALDMSNAIKDLVSRSGNLFAYPATNTLIITDSGANIDRIMKIVKELDQEGPQQVMEIIPIRNTVATQIAKMIQDLFEQQKTTAKARTTRRSKSSQLEELQEVSKIIADERTNSIIVMASKRAIEKVRAIIRKLDSRLRPEDEGRIHVYYLKHAKAKELSEVLSSLTASSGAAASKKGAAKASVAVARFEGGVKITADEATNALIITALPKDFRTLIDKVVSKLDIPRRQVYFESVIMELSLNKGSEYGTSGMGGSALAGSLLGFGQTLGAPSMLGSIVSNSATQGTAAWPALLGGLISSRTTDIPIVGADGTASSITVPAFSAFISALATRGEANVVSTPNLLTLDNEEATMDVLSKEPIPGSTTFGAQGIASAQAVDYKEAGLEMKIKPQITEGDMIRLEIEQKLSGFSTPRFSSNLNAPAMKERKVKTTVVTENGQTVVLAGLMDDTASKTKRKVPILGDIPVIGFLFSMTNNSMSKSNLLIFITPHIIKDRTDFSAILKRKIDERNKFIDSNFSKSKRKKIRKTIKTHREDLLEFTEPVPLDREISMKGKVITVDPEIKKKSEPKPVITVPQSSVTTRGPSVPTTPAMESSKWKPVEPKYSRPVIVKPSYSAPAPVAPQPVRITPAPKSAIKAPAQPVYSQPQVVTPKRYTPEPKKTWKKKKKKVVEEAAPVITESTIEEKAITDTAIKKPAQWLPEQPKTTETMEKVAPEVVKEVAPPPPPAPRVFNKPVIPESGLGATKQPSQEVVPPQVPKEEDRTPKAYIIKVPKKPKPDSGERFQKPDAGGIGTDLDLAY